MCIGVCALVLQPIRGCTVEDYRATDLGTGSATWSKIIQQMRGRRLYNKRYYMESIYIIMLRSCTAWWAITPRHSHRCREWGIRIWAQKVPKTTRDL